MLDFKQKKAVHPNIAAGNNGNNNPRQSSADMVINKLCEERQGWYEGELDFKRVVMVPSTGKFEYRDTKFVARCKANSGMDCYNRIIENLHDRVDSRSQFPSARVRISISSILECGNNFDDKIKLNLFNYRFDHE